jgi:hypothetical protein
MPYLRGYRWGGGFFAFVALCSLASLPYAISCCSRFSAEELADRASFGGNGWAPGITPLAVALLDWPMGFRLLVMTVVAAILCLAATITLHLFASYTAKETLSRRARMLKPIGEAVLGSFIVGVLYILAAYGVGYAGYIGPANAIWFVGIPVLVSLMEHKRLTSAFLWSAPLLLGGWVSMGVFSMTVGIPLD